MTNEEIYEAWAPLRATWSVWAKPVLFAQLKDVTGEPARPDDLAATDTSWAPLSSDHTAMVLDLPGGQSIRLGLLLAARGYRPVPLFNACTGPAAVVPMDAMLEGIARAAPYLSGLSIADDAPPAFLLDADRMRGTTRPAPGSFDNRWMVFPQDFPSATFLLAHRIEGALLVQAAAEQPQDDLAHVLLRWQESGVRLQVLDISAGGAPRPLQVRRPSQFRWLWYRALALVGLRRNSAGGFGMVVPRPSAG